MDILSAHFRSLQDLIPHTNALDAPLRNARWARLWLTHNITTTIIITTSRAGQGQS